MLAIRMQRTGRKGRASFRVVVQDARLSPSSGRVVAQLGHYDPHSKDSVLDKEKTEYYLKNGAQPSERVVKLLIREKVSLPDWVEQPDMKKSRSIKNVEKLRRNRPAEETPEEIETPATSEVAEETPNNAEQPTEVTAEEQTEAPAEEQTAEEEPKEAA